MKKKMTLKEMKEILVSADLDFLANDYASLLNALTLFLSLQSDRTDSECLKKMYDKQSSIIHRSLSERGFYDDLGV